MRNCDNFEWIILWFEEKCFLHNSPKTPLLHRANIETIPQNTYANQIIAQYVRRQSSMLYIWKEPPQLQQKRVKVRRAKKNKI